ncbi:hypothetical protein [Mucilaginibacter sp. SP1R1]|uniref:hypothetical protein n=1 Tax=Mucilaginibacter sp. SP1R1 TaxID=2723091 RepID=UPI0016177CB9|nr:hypothetical protein [Mucilaginibacter sp. SP1R1]MBB6147586.1 hypothetical protein [Mucilaginibacter sp. SP1R1]
MTLSIAVFLLKLAIVILGFGLTAYYFIPGVIKKDYPKIKRAGIIFITTWLFILVIMIIEFTVIKTS